MANKNLFKAAKTPVEVKVNTANKWKETVNQAGGTAFSFPDKLALAQFAVTGTFNNVFYANAEDQLESVKALVAKVDSAFIAKLAVYSHESAFMKDMPAYLLAVLHARQESELLAAVFGRVVSTFKMLSNFVQIVRSGVTGRKSFGTSTKRLIQEWLARKTAMQTFNGSIGLSDPSVSDVIKMVHPNVGDDITKDAVYAYLTEARGWESKLGNLPDDLKAFEALKKGEASVVPNIPFRALTNVNLSVEQWRDIARNMPFNTLRQNLNMLSRRKVFDDSDFLIEIAEKLSSQDEVLKSKVMPFQLFTAYQNTTELPVELTNALQNAAEISTQNVPTFGKKTLVFVDVSGSMRSSVTGYRPGVPQSKTSCVDVAALMASCVLRQNNNAEVVLFDTSVHRVTLNPRDSIVSNAQKIAQFYGGGTDLSVAMADANRNKSMADTVIYVSDNMSWAGGRWGTASEWVNYKKRVPHAKLVNIDIQPMASAQLPDNKDVLNIGGFTDAIWPAIAAFVNDKSGGDFVSTIEESVAL